MLKATGLGDADLERPLVAVVNTWTEVMPCNLHLRALADDVKRGVRAAGGTPIEWNTIAVSDGVTMGTDGMRASLVSRELIADSIELVCLGHLVDAVVCLVGCDKTIPAAAMALARLDIPGLILYGGPIAPGRFQGKDVTIQDVFEGVGAHAAGKMTLADLRTLEDKACPGAGACGGQFTANTMATALTVMGLGPMGVGEIPALSPERAAAAATAGQMVMQLFAAGANARQFITRTSIENAITAVAASGGSTNAVLHLLAIAREAGVPLEIDDFDRLSARTPTIVDIKPGGRFTAVDLYHAGGLAVLCQRLFSAGLLVDTPTVSGRTLRAEADAARERPGQEVITSLDAAQVRHRRARHPARQPRPRWLRHQAVRPQPGAPRRSGPGLRRRGGRVRRGPGRRHQGRRRRRHPLRGPRRRPRHARDARASPPRWWGRGWAAMSPWSPTAASPAPPSAS